MSNCPALISQPSGAATCRPLMGKLRPLSFLIAGLGARPCDCVLVDPVLLPSPAEILFQCFLERPDAGHARGPISSKTIVRTTAARSAIALVIGAAGRRAGQPPRSLYESIEFAIDFFRSTPASAMFPLFLVLFGVGEQTKIAVAAFGAALVPSCSTWPTA